MSGFDYGNARLRAMKSRLLTRQELEDLLEATTLEGLIATLTKTIYRRPIEAALARTSGIHCVDEALRNDIMDTLGKLRAYYHDRAREMVDIVYSFYDVHNIKTILRGLENRVMPNEIMMATMPLGELKETDLRDLARMPDSRGAIDLLVSMGLRYGQPLLEIRATKPGAGIPDIELALDNWVFQNAFQFLKSSNGNARTLHAALQLEADLTNLLTVLRFVHSPGERQFLRDWRGSDSLEELFVGPGELSFQLLGQAGMKDSVEAAVLLFEDTIYRKALHSGLSDYSQSTLLSDFERHLTRYRLSWRAGMIAKDPLGLGVLLGYLALKLNEVSNLRWISKGISIGLNPKEIREMLEHPL